jgi:hypothetical protein
MDRFPTPAAIMNRYEGFNSSDDVDLQLAIVDEDEEVYIASVCPERFVVLMREYPTGGEMVDALRAHVASCVRCGCAKKDVVSDRLMLGTKNSTCCNEVA